MILCFVCLVYFLCQHKCFWRKIIQISHKVSKRWWQVHLELSPLRSLADLMKTKLIRQHRSSPFLSTSVSLTNSDCRTSFNVSCLRLVSTITSLFFVTNRVRCIAYRRLPVLYPTESTHQRTWSNWKSHCSTSRGNSDYTRSDKMPNIFNLNLNTIHCVTLIGHLPHTHHILFNFQMFC